MTTTTRTIARSQSGQPCLWEKGGGMSNTGEATIIAGPEGERLSPVYIRRAGSLAGAEHAMIPVGRGCLVVEASHHRRDYTVTVYRVVTVDGETATLTPVCQWQQGEWDTPPSEAMEASLHAASAKAECYHCREPHYVG